MEDGWGNASSPDCPHESDSAIWDAFRAQVVAMLIVFAKGHTEGATIHQSWVKCFLLYAQPGLDKGSYRRVGTAEINIRELEVGVDNLEAELRKYHKPLQNPWYHETNGDGEYTISVV